MSMTIMNTDFIWSFPTQIPSVSDEQNSLPADIGWGYEDKPSEAMLDKKEKSVSLFYF